MVIKASITQPMSAESYEILMKLVRGCAFNCLIYVEPLSPLSVVACRSVIFPEDFTSLKQKYIGPNRHRGLILNKIA